MLKFHVSYLHFFCYFWHVFCNYLCNKSYNLILFLFNPSVIFQRIQEKKIGSLYIYPHDWYFWDSPPFLWIQLSTNVTSLKLEESPLIFLVLQICWQWILPAFLGLKLSLFCLHFKRYFYGYRILDSKVFLFVFSTLKMLPLSSWLCCLNLMSFLSLSLILSSVIIIHIGIKFMFFMLQKGKNI